MTVNHATSHMSSEFAKTETDEFTIHEGKQAEDRALLRTS